MDNEQVVFIRHNFDPVKELRSLQPQDKNKLLIAFDYHGKGYLSDFNKYSEKDLEGNKGFPTTYAYFKKLQEIPPGRLVCSEYADRLGQFFIGVTNCSNIENKDYDWINKDGKLEKCKLATLEIDKVSSYSYSEYPVLLASRPPRNTMCKRSNDASSILTAIYKKQKIAPKLQLISANNLEQMCCNFLINEQLVYKYFYEKNNLPKSSSLVYFVNYLALKVGKSMPEIDICGKNNNNEWVFAQVCYKAKFDREVTFFNFVSRSTGSRGILFSRELINNNKMPKQCIHIPVKDLFDFLLKETPQMIYDLIGVPKDLIIY